MVDIIQTKEEYIKKYPLIISLIIVQPETFTVEDLDFLETDVVIKKSNKSFFEVGYLIIGEKDSQLVEISKTLREQNMKRNKYGPKEPYPPAEQ